MSAETQAPDVVGEEALTPAQTQLWQKAKKAVEASNFGYAATIAQSIVSQEPRFLQGRRLARSAAVRQNQGQKKSFGSKSASTSTAKGLVKKDPMGAMAELEKQLIIDPFNKGANELLHDVAVANNMPSVAAFALETLFEGNPDDSKLGHRLGDWYLSHNLAGKAATVFNTMVKRNPGDLAASQKAIAATAQDSMTKNNWSESQDMKNLKTGKEEANDLDMKNRAGMTREQIESEIAKYLEKYNANANDINVVKHLAALYEQYNDLPSALQFSEWAHHLSEGDVSLEAKVARLRAKVRNDSLEALKADLDANPDDADKQAEYDALVAESTQQAIDEGRAAVDRNPTDPTARFELGSALYKAGEYSDAIQELQRAKNAPAIRTKVLLTLGRCFLQKNMNDLAATQLSAAAAEINGMDELKKEILYDLALVYEKGGDQENYIGSLKQIYEADYGYKDVATRVEASYA